MKKYLKKQQVEKMFKNDIQMITLRRNINKQFMEAYWQQFLTSIYNKGGITRHQYDEWSYLKICD